MNSWLFHSRHWSIMFLNMNICCIHPFPLLNPACSFLSLLSSASLILTIITLPSTLLGTDNNVTPLQLLQFSRSPFLGNLMRRIGWLNYATPVSMPSLAGAEGQSDIYVLGWGDGGGGSLLNARRASDMSHPHI